MYDKALYIPDGGLETLAHPGLCTFFIKRVNKLLLKKIIYCHAILVEPVVYHFFFKYNYPNNIKIHKNLLTCFSFFIEYKRFSARVRSFVLFKWLSVIPSPKGMLNFVCLSLLKENQIYIPPGIYCLLTCINH